MDEEISAWERWAGAILGAFERHSAVLTRIRRERRCAARQSDGRSRKLRTEGMWLVGTREAVSRALQGEAWAGEGDQARVRTASGRRYAHAQGAGTHRAHLKEIVE